MTVAVITHDGIITPLDNSEIAVGEREFNCTKGGIALIDIDQMDINKVEDITTGTYFKISDDIDIVIECSVIKIKGVATFTTRENITSSTATDKVSAVTTGQNIGAS